MPPAVAFSPISTSGTRCLTFVAFIVGGTMLGVWLWSRVCVFPSVPWNDMRLAPAIALTQGATVYPTADEGTINTWMYGPLPLLVNSLAALAPTAAGALVSGALINASVTLLSIACVCFMWPRAPDKPRSTTARCLAFLVSIAAWPEMAFTTLFSDNLAIACGMIGNLVLIRSGRARGLWFAALISTAAVACKQTSLGIPMAQVLWVGITLGRRAGLLHAARCVLMGGAVGAGAIALFGWDGLWFSVVQVPAHVPWAPNLPQRLLFAAPDLLFAIGVPLMVMLFCRLSFIQPRLLLPALAWACTLPLGLTALFKLGGWTNSLHGFPLWLAPTLTVILTNRIPVARRDFAYFAAALVTVGIACGRILATTSLPLRMQIEAYVEAESFVPRLNGQLWLPLHPVVTLYSERRYYHDEDGFYVRRMSHKSISPAQAAANLPPAMHLIAYRTHWVDWGIARGMMPAGARVITIGGWTLMDGARLEPQ